MNSYIVLALQFHATVYGVHRADLGRAERFCGDPGKAVACDSRATTASGERFDPKALTVAVPMPIKKIVRPVEVCLRNPETGREVVVRVTDKKNARYLGNGGFDLTPAVYEALTGEPARWFSRIENLEEC